MTIKEVVATYLETEGFDGLFNENGCGCLNNDLMPCDEPQVDCEPGYKRSGDADAGWYVGPNKEVPDAEPEV